MWYLTTSSGEQHSFDVVVSAAGSFTQPVMPSLVEDEPFTGTVMHSARWDHSVDLRGSRIAVTQALQIEAELSRC
jgi:cyclohexanone monooxygenase